MHDLGFFYLVERLAAEAEAEAAQTRHSRVARRLSDTSVLPHAFTLAGVAVVAAVGIKLARSHHS